MRRRRRSWLWTNSTARRHLRTWQAAAMEEGATRPQAARIASEVMEDWGDVPIGAYAPGRGPIGQARRMARELKIRQG